MGQCADRDVVYTTNGRIDQNCLLIDAAADTSSTARPATWATAARTSSGVMLSSSRRCAPASSASSISAASRTSTASGELRPGRARPSHRLAHAARQRGVVLLDQDEVEQTDAVVDAAAVRDRGLLEHPQPGRGLARVEDLRPALAHATATMRAVFVATPGQPAEEVQRRALGGQDARAPSPRPAAPARPRATRPPAPSRCDARLRIEPQEHGLGDLEAGDHPGRLLRDRGDGRAPRRRPSPRWSRRRRRRPRRARDRSGRCRSSSITATEYH